MCSLITIVILTLFRADTRKDEVIDRSVEAEMNDLISPPKYDEEFMGRKWRIMRSKRSFAEDTYRPWYLSTGNRKGKYLDSFYAYIVIYIIANYSCSQKFETEDW